MKRFPNERLVFTVLILSSALIVLGVAGLLYRWSNRVSEMTTVRLADSLQMSMANWHLNFFRDLSDVCLMFRGESEDRVDMDHFAQLFVEWQKTARYPMLVANIYFLKSAAAGVPQVYRVNAAGPRFQRVEGIPPAVPWQRLAASGPASTPKGPGSEGTPQPLNFYPSAGPVPGWRFEPTIPALIRPMGPELNGRAQDWIIIELSRNEMREHVLPDLARRYFSGVDGLDYMVAVVAETPPRQVLYSSDPDFAREDVADADGRMDVFGEVTARTFGSPIFIFHKLAENARLSGLEASIGSWWFPPLGPEFSTTGWQLVVRHRRGGALGAFVAEMHRRDLAIGFGILFLLVITVSMLIVTSQRARRLGRLQMEFVTAVSHELRSPLTIIRSAAENLGEGVVETRDQVKRYASAIERQTRRLSRLVEEILLFASTNKGRHHYDAVELEVGDIIDAALTALNDLVEASHFTIEREVPPDLPKVVGDRFALSQCLQNLIINALKYGGAERWIGIKASIDDSPLASKEIRIDVSDYGLGISAADLPHVFEAFYRSPMVTATQIHGTGLGLSLAQSIAESMGGRLTVTSSLNQGSTFTLCLPCATPPLEGLEPRMTRITRMGRDISTPSA